MFRFLITPYLIDIAYIIGVIFPFYIIYLFYYKIKYLLKIKKVLIGIVLVIFMYEIMLRVFFEFIIVYFSIYEELKEIKKSL